MSDPRIRVNSVVQIDPAHDPRFGACFLTVTEIKSWGVQGFVKVPGVPPDGGDAYYRVAFEHVVYIGDAEWSHPRNDEPEPRTEKRNLKP